MCKRVVAVSKSQERTLIISIVVLMLLAAFALFIGDKFGGDKAGEAGVKEIIFEVIGPDGESKEYTIQTEAENLSDALFEEGLVTEKEHEEGYFTVIDGIEADWNADKAWWCITVDGEMSNVGMGDIMLEQGGHYEATYTID